MDLLSKCHSITSAQGILHEIVKLENYLNRLFNDTDIAATDMELLSLYQGASCSNRTITSTTATHN